MSRRGAQPLVHDPERLVHDRELGKLLSSANAAYRSGLDESGAFQRLSERLEAPARRSRWEALTLGAVLSAAAGVVMVLGVFDPAPSRVAVGPEISSAWRTARDGREAPGVALEARASADAVPTSGSSPEGPAGSGTNTELREPEPREPEVARSEASSSSRARAQLVPAPELEPRPGQPTLPSLAPRSTAPSSAARTPEARVDCSDLLEKDARAAEHCYAQRAAESSGLSAEAALYELARLRRDVQQDAKGALTALNEYRERFPRGSLRNEVGLSRVELLSELGRSREALSEAEALLGSAKERAAELYLLRGDIFRRDLTDFARAAQEYSKAESFGGGFGAEATRLRGLSLEALGDVEGALAAYRRYLSGPDQPRKGEVNRRVEALTSTQRGATP